ncbi:hypothetical protein PSN45_001364 [Yamadazyma tenuis]|uniref:Uncharacterized protein n=1 Tax=Candida tenuis (strain ATCC 10573 / BCRC 21748 / CBS 615 / JCM 9827 / NBRC 10315 / NRRL Y-1498 / VKM Y-70) TaxID=590646 RepID=G3BCP0_CANTC|nr:uncharacterized protein CANTEDRAFT_116904 [Yamadazyma tenuis ATCC 10573]XP_006690058.1 uncharacterized protein CANTEDRAFT_116904 [Yamadazyma tenuis ATCC 10573]EGV60843.1 hypothetical protein CANTEDRAFT_116904 [Yamadazyma tenuis ATCC 10573]EGV60844.1 hypothetical protein CANTEDRAFT_116904 [Yamadazyma tenuis ATCC 10573]WEJ93887.1 hypothetical protein PSN45_001364 [Yamadazyma tenuis]
MFSRDSKTRRPLSQSLSLTNLHLFTRSREPSLSHTKSSAPLQNITNTAINTSRSRPAKQRYSSLFDKENETRQRLHKRFSVNFKQVEDSDSDDETIKSINTSPFTNNDMMSLNLSSITLEDEEPSKDKPELSKSELPKDDKRMSRMSNLSSILEFVHQINYDVAPPFGDPAKSKVFEEVQIGQFNATSDYHIKLVHNAMLFQYDEADIVDPLGLDDIDYAAVFAAPYHEELSI